MRVLIIDNIVFYREALGQQFLCLSPLVSGLFTADDVKDVPRRSRFEYILAHGEQTLHMLKTRYPKAHIFQLYDDHVPANTVTNGFKRSTPVSVMLQTMGLLSHELSWTRAHHPLLHKLSRKEREIVSHLVTGASNQDIAKNLGIALATVKLHMRNICTKLEAKNRTQAALIAYSSLNDMLERDDRQHTDMAQTS